MTKFLALLLGVCVTASGRPVCPDIDPPEWVVEETEAWRDEIQPMLFGRPNLTAALVLAVIAQESQGLEKAESADGGVGLMQLTAGELFGSREHLLNTRINLDTGMKVLDQVIRDTDGDVLLALALYNCSEEMVLMSARGKFQTCGAGGGFDYAHKVLGYWCPIFETDPSDLACAEQHSQTVYRFGDLFPRVPGSDKTSTPIPLQKGSDQGMISDSICTNGDTDADDRRYDSQAAFACTG